ncbi:MAG: hypothetical protein Q8N48_01110 [Thiobacillus sp.]|nr:hypothetical protein [Thiobacillus sp.]MDP2977409.1 hypothetical protein [Thiobacillus sp.]
MPIHRLYNHESLVKQAKEQQQEAVQGLMRGVCDEINGHLEAHEQVHHATPSPDERLAINPIVEWLFFKGQESSFGSRPAEGEIRKLPFGAFSWFMSGNESITEVVG